MPRSDKTLKTVRYAETSKDAPVAARYDRIIEAVFQRHWKKGKVEFTFERDELIQVCRELTIDVPKNIGDVIYTFRYRKALPKSILATGRRIGDGSSSVTEMPGIVSA